jgi:hypothetical protein
MDAFKRGETTEDEYWRSFIKALDVNLTINEVKEMLVKNYVVDRDSIYGPKS